MFKGNDPALLLLNKAFEAIWKGPIQGPALSFNEPVKVPDGLWIITLALGRELSYRISIGFE